MNDYQCLKIIILLKKSKIVVHVKYCSSNQLNQVKGTFFRNDNMGLTRLAGSQAHEKTGTGQDSDLAGPQ